MPHAVLLGDSVFDNAAYVVGGPDVIAQLRDKLPTGWRASLAAVDGSTIADIASQLDRLPSDATHLIVSVGGNDALGHSAILSAPSHSVADTLIKLSDIQQEFRITYSQMIEAVLRRQLPTAFCTIYDPRYPDPIQRRVATTALAVLNDSIIREAVVRGLPLIDLRLVCSEDSDFANPIEPSVKGGWKIAAAIVSLLSQRTFALARSAVFIR
jgi:GDSL-like Lipase/Acylhydrolase family